MDHETETVGWITRKHVYEIAKLKSEDTLWQMVDLQDVCKKVIDYAYRMGVKVRLKKQLCVMPKVLQKFVQRANIKLTWH